MRTLASSATPAIDVHPQQEMGGAGNAGIVVADDFFAMQAQRVVRMVEPEVQQRQPQVLLDAPWFWLVGGTMRALTTRPSPSIS
jgi:hypothetical protein